MSVEKGKNPVMVDCPVCGRKAAFFDEPIGPFCSKRCKMVDLGYWFNEDYRMSEPLSADAFEEYESLEGPDLDHPESGT